MCGLRWCWCTSPGVHMSLIVGQEQMFLSVHVCLCVFAWLLCQLCADKDCVHSCLPDPNVSITAEMPLCQCECTWPTSISLFSSCSSLSASLNLCLLTFVVVLYVDIFKGVVSSYGSHPMYWYLFVSSSMCWNVTWCVCMCVLIVILNSKTL